ncbi:protein-L-isoaspartate O-methyltransferase family protein [Brachybacterium alimentarium]|uniref:Protein-L-isoaspartate O-methyltransferase n=1 Tax=Brachybacterium alimentarium TaxID=47845 RepID=A0A2A3YM86_9MICO|nr:methyltransferase domain-containing protein [Brachybacterium alimentarium]PCC40408.1 protein-L-isoaspartate carboxylmethyltransferase [Brachybacterium alimentarium]RCS67780.1 methyltransferase domain-containing protein [Brachybacterium alimentarium]RCS68162.1 methyltransferase domain-containing protein [Brachybacterium alimentarium]RCS75195.1 methyltransferase domain-containing protein [Brachybacterium alimentarium]RCS81043.1 methyltransferase domain-containing protein [Brachybacterium alim
MAHDDSVDRAFRVVPRAPFLPADQRHRAGRDAPLPIGHGQTNSQPFTVGAMLRLLDVKPGSRVLDLGSGSGWTTALLAHLVGPEGAVIGVERQEALIEPSRRALATTDHEARTEIRLARPGVLGAPEDAPFDRILVSAEAREMPSTLLEQLADGGVMVIPVGSTMHRVERDGDELRDTEHGAFRFVPLIED